MSKCLFCYKDLGPGEVDFHKSCCRKFFGTASAPVLDYTREEMDASKHIHKVDNYFDLFTGMFGQPGAPSYTRVTVTRQYLLLESFKVLPNGTTELFNTLKIVH